MALPNARVEAQNYLTVPSEESMFRVSAKSGRSGQGSNYEDNEDQNGCKLSDWS